MRNMKTDLQNATITLGLMRELIEQCKANLEHSDPAEHAELLQKTRLFYEYMENRIKHLIAVQKDIKSFEEVTRTLKYFHDKIFSPLFAQEGLSNLPAFALSVDDAAKLFSKQEKLTILTTIGQLAVDVTNDINPTVASRIAWLTHLQEFYKKNNFPVTYIDQTKALIEEQEKFNTFEAELTGKIDNILNNQNMEASDKIVAIKAIKADAITKIPAGYPATYFDRHTHIPDILYVALKVEINDKIKKILASNVLPSEKLTKINKLLSDNKYRNEEMANNPEYFSEVLSNIEDQKAKKKMLDFLSNTDARQPLIDRVERSEARLLKHMSAILNDNNLTPDGKLQKITALLATNKNMLIKSIVGKDALRELLGDKNFMRLNQEAGNANLVAKMEEIAKRRDKILIKELLEEYSQHDQNLISATTREQFHALLSELITRKLNTRDGVIGDLVREIYNEINSYPSISADIITVIQPLIKQKEDGVIKEINDTLVTTDKKDYISQLNFLELIKEKRLGNMPAENFHKQLPNLFREYDEKKNDLINELITQIITGNASESLKIIADIDNGLLKLTPLPENLQKVCLTAKAAHGGEVARNEIQKIYANENIFVLDKLEQINFIANFSNTDTERDVIKVIKSLQKQLTASVLDNIKNNNNLSILQKAWAIDLLYTYTEDKKLKALCNEAKTEYTSQLAGELIATSRAAFQKFSVAAFLASTEKNPYKSELSILCSNLEAMIKQDILSCQSLEQRARVLRKWIEVGMTCLIERDFNSVITIGSTLNNPEINLLYLTKSKLSTEERTALDTLTQVAQPINNFSIYQKYLRENQDKPTVPHLAYFGKSHESFAGAVEAGTTRLDPSFPTQTSWMLNGETDTVVAELIKYQQSISAIPGGNYRQSTLFLDTKRTDQHQLDTLRSLYENRNDPAVKKAKLLDAHREEEISKRRTTPPKRDFRVSSPTITPEMHSQYSEFNMLCSFLLTEIDNSNISPELKQKFHQTYDLAHNGIIVELSKNNPKKSVVDTSLYIACDQLKELIAVLDRSANKPEELIRALQHLQQASERLLSRYPPTVTQQELQTGRDRKSTAVPLAPATPTQSNEQNIRAEEFTKNQKRSTIKNPLAHTHTEIPTRRP